MATTFYEAVGGDAGVLALVNRFYDLMDSEPEFRELRELHPADLTGSREKLYLFLSGWLGGPPLYIQKHGHPRLRARHLPFPIGENERDQWLRCMQRAVNESEIHPFMRQQLMDRFVPLADFMRNKEENV
jgi:hemoglobin